MTSSAFVRLVRRASAIASIAGASLSVTLAAFAQTPPEDSQTAGLPTVVVTAARLEQPLAAALPSTRVIEREEIERTQASDLPGLLRMLTSVDVAQTGPLGSQTSVFLRGNDSRQTLVLVDGQPINRGDFGSASIQHLPIDQIERVEIGRGNVSSLYGAQAVGGVIQIFTRRASAPQVSVEVGSRGTRAGAFAAGTRLGDASTPTDISVSASTRRTNGFSAKDPGSSTGANPDDDSARQQGGTLRVAQIWAPGHVTSVSLLAERTRNDFDAFTPGLSDTLTTHLETVSIDSKHPLGDALQLQWNLGQVKERFDDPTAPQNFGAAEGDNRVRRVGSQLQWQAVEGHILQTGVEHANERFDDSNTSSRSRSTDSLRLAWLANPTGAPWQSQLALRYDDNDSYGSATTGLVALGWRLSTQWRLSLQAATAFSAPSLIDEQFANPNDSLEPERSRNAEVALQFSEGATLARVAWFGQKQRDRIDFDPVTFEAGNIARASNYGVELQAQTVIGGARFGADATFQDPRNTDTDQQLLRRSRQSASLSYSQSWGLWDWGSVVRYVGKRRDIDPDTFTRVWNPSRTTGDLTLARTLGRGWQIAAKIQNVGDSSTPDVVGYNPEPRGIFATLRWNGEQ